MAIRKKQIYVTECLCERCGYQWIPKLKMPRMCGKCKSKFWNKPKGQIVFTFKEIIESLDKFDYGV